jgi:DNA-binding NarL/FixJ family response regulator
MEAPPTLVGRESERATLRGALAAAAVGEPSLVLVHGEAGIGKTSLVREAARAVEVRGGHVLVGQCLRFGATVTTLAPFIQAIARWLRTVDSASRARLALGGRLDDVVPALGDPRDGVALLQIGQFLDVLQADRPTLLLIDDLQWADPSSLDMLSYLVGGFGEGQRLAILATYRDTDLDDGHRLHGWLADVIRMPSVTQFRLERLDLWAVEEMILARGDIASVGALTEAIHRLSNGNPYLAELLISDISVSGGDVSTGGRLTNALLASWHRLPASSRRVTQLLAVAGAPAAPQVLRDLAARRGLSATDTDRAVDMATAEGITITTESGAVWFRHPLLAETIAATLKSWEMTHLHQDLASIWEAATAVDERDRANALSTHYLAAGDIDQGFVWSLRAADEAGAVRGWEERASHLSTAVALYDRLPQDSAHLTDKVELLIAAARACEAAGDYPGAVMHGEGALASVDRSANPALASHILLDLHTLRASAGLGLTHLSLAEPKEVLALTERIPDSEARALAFAHLAFAEVLNGLKDATQHAETAVRLAERAGTPKSLIWALGTRALTTLGTERGIADAQQAFRLATDTDDAQLHNRAAIFLSNSYESAGRIADAAETIVRSYRALLDAGQFDYAASVGAVAARWCFQLGRWHEVRPMVRELLTIARSNDSAAESRCAAALLTAHQGNHAAAALHLRRAEELMPTAAPIGDPLTDTQIRVAIAVGDPLGALERIGSHMSEAVEIDPISADEWLELASRAALQLTIHSTDTGLRDRAIRALDLIEVARGTKPTPFTPAGPLDVVHPAQGALHAAQRAQFAGADVGVAELWELACEATFEADMQYEHARSLYHLARYLLTHGGGRKRASTALATSGHIAASMEARTLRQAIEDLASQTHLTLPSMEPQDSGATALAHAFPGSPALTPRELEVAEGLIAGETYAQIAHRLFISDKTVSSHVSNILRKSGATSRIELRALARGVRDK